MNRELDEAIALLLGWQYQQNAPEGHHCFINGNDKGWWKAPDWKGWGCASCGDGPPQYSEDGNEMLELDAEMRKRGWYMEVWTLLGKWHRARFTRVDGCMNPVVFIDAHTLPEAVAKAAYRALKGVEWKGDAE